MDKMFHHHKDNESQSGAAKEGENKPSFGQKLKAEEKKEGGKFHNYMKEDQQMEAEGKEYGGLM
jgi:hypothetical protein